MPRKVDVDTKTFVRFWLVILAFAFLVWFVLSAASGLLVVAIAIFLALAIHPLAELFDKLDPRKNRPKLTATLAFILVVAVIGVIMATIGPVVVEQTSQFISSMPTLFNETFGGWDGINSFGEALGVADLQQKIYNALSAFVASFSVDSVGSMVFGSISAIAGFFTSAILVLVLTLLFLLEGPDIVAGLWRTFRANKTEVERRPVIVLERVINRMADTVSTYVSRQVIVALLDGVIVALAVFALSALCGVSAALALPLGLFATIFFLIPMFGPIISCVVISLVLFASSPIAGVSFLIFYIIYEQIANNVISPKLQGNALNLPASLILVAVVIGTYMFGLFGAIISIPIAGCIKVLAEEYPQISAANRSRRETAQKKRVATAENPTPSSDPPIKN